MFKTPQTDVMMAGAILEHMEKNNVKTLGYVGFNDALGEAFFAEIDKAAFDKYKTGIASVDKGLQWAVDSMKITKFRPVTPAAVELYDQANNAWNDVLAKGALVTCDRRSHAQP